MAPNKFENNIKKTLEERQIQPSSNAWNQLSDSLDKQNKKSSNTYIWFMGIAASIIGLLFVVNTFQPFQEIENTSNPVVVETSSENNLEIDSKVETTKMVTISEEENKSLVENLATDIPTNNQTSKRQKVSAKRYTSVDKNEAREMTTNNTNVVEKISNKSKQIINNNTSENTIAQSEVSNVIVDSDLNSEVDALLKQATSKVSSVSGSEETDYNINPNNLLEDVEMDLEKSFRDKVFETIKTNFTIVKTAVADRNN
ncbi:MULTISPECIES: hypothetical protein [Bizionia]|uniref:Uncharacterized protein n=1 Tax=Bizionia algoritergicola TaxID=291187 RepID=A0A5D0R246_9FLAO|nr:MULTISPECIES: hypothetical protein [Bizionia]OBX23917.1 hypothetical protein BAA08_02885 [Bizionia sp. APA-3]TYB75610.1 hypothetical protein ES675_05680 [Bizionia algoritergicola]